jgi:hypothetical protein
MKNEQLSQQQQQQLRVHAGRFCATAKTRRALGTTADKTRWCVRWRVRRRVRAWKSGLLSVTRPKSSARVSQPTWRLGRRDQIEMTWPNRCVASMCWGWVGLGWVCFARFLLGGIAMLIIDPIANARVNHGYTPVPKLGFCFYVCKWFYLSSFIYIYFF